MILYLYIDLENKSDISKDGQYFWWEFNSVTRKWNKGDALTLIDIEDYIIDWMDSMELSNQALEKINLVESFTINELEKAQWLLKTKRQLLRWERLKK